MDASSEIAMPLYTECAEGVRVLRLIRSSAFSACSAVKFKDIVISLDFPIVPVSGYGIHTILE